MKKQNTPQVSVEDIKDAFPAKEADRMWFGAFQEELTNLINLYGIDSRLNTADFALAEHLTKILLDPKIRGLRLLPKRIHNEPIPLSTPGPVHDDGINHPSYYGGADNPYEAIKVVEAWNLGTHLDTAVIYLSRVGKKDDPVKDMKKAIWWIQRKIDQLEEAREEVVFNTTYSAPYFSNDGGATARKKGEIRAGDQLYAGKCGESDHVDKLCGEIKANTESLLEATVKANLDAHPVDKLFEEITGLEDLPRGFFQKSSDGRTEFCVLPGHPNPDYVTPTGADEFINQWNGFADYVHTNARDKGFWKDRDELSQTKAGQLACDIQAMGLIHSEIGEATEGLRKDAPDDHLPQFKSVEVELADAIIRIAEYAAGRKWRVAEAVKAKVEYNASRAYMHGKQC